MTWPKSISIDITSCCNIDCTICSLKKEYNPKGHMSQETLDNIKPYLKHVGNVELCCNAEPTIHPQFISFLKQIKDSTKGIVNFPTNGLLLDENMIKEIIKNDIYSIRISMDGATKQTYETIRQGSNFGKVINNVKNINEIKKHLGRTNPKVVLVFVAMKDNIHELPQIIELANELKIKDIIIHGYECYSEELKEQPLYLQKSEQYKNYLEEAKQTSQKYGIHIQLPEYCKDKRMECDRNDFCVITWDGEVTPCAELSYTRHSYFEDKKISLKQLSFGNVNNDSFENIWNSKLYKKFRETTNREAYEECQKCLINFGVIVPPLQ